MIRFDRRRAASSPAGHGGWAGRGLVAKEQSKSMVWSVDNVVAIMRIAC